MPLTTFAQETSSDGISKGMKSGRSYISREISKKDERDFSAGVNGAAPLKSVWFTQL